MENFNIQLINRLDKFVSAFTGISNLNGMIQSIENFLEGPFCDDQCCLYLYDSTEKRLKLFWAKGLDKEEFLCADQTIGDRYPGSVFRSAQILYIPDSLSENDQLAKFGHQNHVAGSQLYLPVMNGNKVVGTFEITNSKPNAYKEEDKAILSIICNLAGSLYGNILDQEEMKKEFLIVKETENIADTSNKSRELERINQAFSIMVANISDVIAIIDDKGTNTYKSPNIEKLFGWSPEEVIGASAFENVHPDDLGRVQTFFGSVILEPNIRKKFEFRYRCKDANYKWVELTVVNLLHDPGINGVLANYHDITERKMAEDKLRESEAKFNNIFNNSPALMLLLTVPDRQISAVNDTFLRKTGLTREEIVGKVITDVELLSFADQQPQIAGELQKYQRINSLELKLKNKNGAIINGVLSRELIESYGKQYFVVLITDITERKAAEEELNKLSRAVEQSPVMTYITDLNGEIEYVNPKVIELTEYSNEELIGKNLNIFSSGENPKEDYSNLWQTISAGKEWRGEFHKRKKNGKGYWVMASVSPVFNVTGNITHFISVEEDITQRIEDYEALKIANLRFKSLISSMHAGVMVEDEHRKVVLVNQYFCDLFKIPLPPEQLIGMDCEDAAEVSKYLFDDHNMFINDINTTLSRWKVVTNHELHMVIGTFLERDFIPIEDFDFKNQGILWIYRDITKRKNNERDLLRQSQILNGTAQAMNYLLTLPDHNEAIQKALEAIGIAAGVDRVYIFGDDEFKITGKSNFTQKFEWATSRVIPQIDINELREMSYISNFPRWYDHFSAGRTVSGLTKDFPENERLVLQNEGIKSIIVVPVLVNELLWGMIGFDDCTAGIEWSDNEIVILQALAGSIGGSIERKIIEDELINARQIAEYATKTKSEFLATMSHEIRTPMNGVIGMTSLLMQTELTYDQRDYAETIKISGELLLNLINDILDFSKIESGKMVLEEQSFDLRMAIEDVLDLMASAAFDKKLSLYYNVDPAIPEQITGDLTRLRQILVNLAGNAIKFTTQGEVVISIKQIEVHGNGLTLEFSVKDTGVGIPEEKIDRLFKPFSQVDASTTRKYGGTGLGLVICDKLVKLMKGNISVKSKVNQGSEFLFTIKTTNSQGKEPLKPPNRDLQILKGKKVLIVDWNPTSLDILNKIFKDLNINTSDADSAQKCLNIINESKDFDLILLDNDIPGVEIDQLLSDIKSIKGYSDCPIILMAFVDMKENQPDKATNLVVRINKPLKHSQLVAYMINIFSENKINKIQSINRPDQIQKLNEVYPLNILVAEDNAINQKLISRLFEMLGYDIHIAANGYEAINALNRMKIDIIFMDIQMPEMDGLEATRQIIAKWGDKRPLIVAMTANALQSDKEKCLATGMDDYISKPLTIVQVSKGIEQWATLCHANGKAKQ